jgi:hypothetical protein
VVSGQFDLAQSLQQAPATGRGALELIADFLTEWQDPIGPGDGVEDAVLREAEDRLGFAVPSALRAFYRLVGRRADLTRQPDPIPPPAQLRVVQGALVFREENQRLAFWGVPVEELSRDDPPVVWSTGPDHPGEPWMPYAERLSLDLVEHVLSETMLKPGSHTFFADIEGQETDGLLSRFTRLAIPEHVLWAVPDGGPVRWFGSRDIVIRDDAGVFLWASCRVKEAVDELRDLVPVDWEPMAE